jgi:O-Antigen ligase
MVAKIDNNFEKILLTLASVLIIIWPLSHTIAIRNICIIFGGFISIIWFYKKRPNIPFLSILPIILLLIVPASIFIRYMVQPSEPSIQLKDLSSTWFRVSIGVLFGWSIGLIAKERKSFLYILFIAVLFLPSINFIYFLIFGYEDINKVFRGLYKYKSALLYFAYFSLLYSIAIINFQLLIFKVKVNNSIFILSVITLFFCIVNFIIGRSLTGLILFFILLSYLIIFNYNNIKYKINSVVIFYIIIFSLILILILLYFFLNQDIYLKLINLLSDIRVSIHISGGVFRPYDPNLEIFTHDGRLVNGSTYERTTWFLGGIKILQAYPFGAGFTQLPFQYLARLSGIEQSLSKTHSGWLDLALGVGIPCIILVWAAILIISLAAIRFIKHSAIKSFHAYLTLWVLVGLWMLWWPAELSEREFIEHFFFVISFLAGLIETVNTKINNIKNA